MTVPKLRFKEFDGDWTLASLNQLSSKIGDGIHATPKYDENGTIPFINGNNLVNGQIIINGNTKRINTEEFQKYNQILSDQTLFLSINGTIGNLAFYKNEQILLGKSVCFINLKNDIDKKFIYLLLQSPQLTKTFNSELTGTTIKNLSLATVRNSGFYYPREKEQTKIASFLSAVDEKITQLTQKHQLLSQYKQGMMQKLFSQQIRFNADDGSEFEEWKKTEIKNISKIFDGTHQTPNYVTAGVPFYSVEHVAANNFKNTKYIAEDVYLAELKRVQLEKGDILLTRIGDIGTCKLIDWDVRASFYVSLALIKVNKQHSSSFVNQYIKSNLFQKELHERTIHVAFPKKINLGEIGLCLIQLPCLEEQTKIANFLSAIDQKINVVSGQIEQAKLWKKGLLQQMFV